MTKVTMVLIAQIALGVIWAKGGAKVLGYGRARAQEPLKRLNFETDQHPAVVSAN